jgi:hypothetical protein
MNTEQSDLAQASQAWKTKTLVIGSVVGALVGATGAFLLVQNAERKNLDKVSVSSGEAFRLGVLILGLLRSIATLYQE